MSTSKKSNTLRNEWTQYKNTQIEKTMLLNIFLDNPSEHTLKQYINASSSSSSSFLNDYKFISYPYIEKNSPYNPLVNHICSKPKQFIHIRHHIYNLLQTTLSSTEVNIFTYIDTILNTLKNTPIFYKYTSASNTEKIKYIELMMYNAMKQQTKEERLKYIIYATFLRDYANRKQYIQSF